MKKIVAIVMVGVMALGMLCMAAGSPSARAIVASASSASASSSTSSAETPEERAASEAGMSVPEYLNNAIISVPGLEGNLPVGQGGHVEINGAPSNYTITMVKPSKADVSLALDKAAAEKGKIVCFFGIKACRFKTAKVNFYVQGMKKGTKLVAFQYVDGAWKKVVINEIREDHVVVTLENNSGRIVFIEK